MENQKDQENREVILLGIEALEATGDFKIGYNSKTKEYNVRIKHKNYVSESMSNAISSALFNLTIRNKKDGN